MLLEFFGVGTDSKPIRAAGRLRIGELHVSAELANRVSNVVVIGSDADRQWMRGPRGSFIGVLNQRLARSIGDLQDIVRALREKGAQLQATEQPINTSTAAGKASAG